MTLKSMTPFLIVLLTLSACSGGADPGPSPSPAAPPDPDLVGWWKLDETTEGPVVDSSSAGNHGILRGPKVGEKGILGGAYSFDGVDDYIAVADSASLKVQDQVTVLAWSYLTSDSVTRFLIRKRNNYGLGFECEPHVDFWVPDHPHATIFRPVYEGAHGWTIPPFTQKNAWFLNAWHQLGFTYDGTQLVCYVDGRPDGKPTAATGKLDTREDLPLTIGQSSFSCQYFQGLIDDVRVYKRALTADEIRALYEAAGR